MAEQQTADQPAPDRSPQLSKDIELLRRFGRAFELAVNTLQSPSKARAHVVTVPVDEAPTHNVFENPEDLFSYLRSQQKELVYVYVFFGERWPIRVEPNYEIDTPEGTVILAQGTGGDRPDGALFSSACVGVVEDAPPAPPAPETVLGVISEDDAFDPDVTGTAGSSS